jgi:hypothetical protein
MTTFIRSHLQGGIKEKKRKSDTAPAPALSCHHHHPLRILQSRYSFTLSHTPHLSSTWFSDGKKR